MIEPVIQDVSEGRLHLMRFTLDQYHRMIECNLLPEDSAVEFVDGFVVRKDRSARGEGRMTIGRAHAWVITQLAKLTHEFAARNALLRMQLPVSLVPDNEPEPDAAIVRADPDDYAAGHPVAVDVYCVIEVSDSSLESDRVTKQRTYAEAGLPLYVIVNLPDRVIEVRTHPLPGEGRYAVMKPVSRSQMLALPTGDGGVLDVPAARLLPAFT